MSAISRIEKKVYSRFASCSNPSPYKSRMDIKDASTNDPSLPLIYYSVNDYEREELHIKLQSSEYLCVELSCIYPDDSDSKPKEDDGPFLSPPKGYGKTVLFQGAVPYTSLQQVYGQKSSGSGLRALRQSVGSEPRREYVMMRGPNGKGQCQVCVTEPVTEETSEKGSSWGERIRKLGAAVVKATGAAIIEGGGGVGEGAGELECSMTYVNVPWQSIVLDLIRDITPDSE
jgi:hypothetical protein